MQECFQVAGKIDWTLQVVRRWPVTCLVCVFPPVHKSVLKKLDNDVRLTVVLAVQLFALSYKDNDLCRISTVSETRTVQNATAETCFKLMLKCFFFFQKVIVWQWPNCGQYLHWCIAYSFFAHPSQYFDKCPSALCFNWHYITLYMGVCTQI